MMRFSATSQTVRSPTVASRTASVLNSLSNTRLFFLPIHAPLSIFGRGNTLYLLNSSSIKGGQVQTLRLQQTRFAGKRIPNPTPENVTIQARFVRPLLGVKGRGIVKTSNGRAGYAMNRRCYRGEHPPRLNLQPTCPRQHSNLRSQVEGIWVRTT